MSIKEAYELGHAVGCRRSGAKESALARFYATGCIKSIESFAKGVTDGTHEYELRCSSFCH